MPYRFLFALLLASLLPAAVAQPTEGQQVDGIIAVVGRNVVLHSDADALALQITRGQLSQEARCAALDELITQNVLVEHALRDTTLSVSPDEVNQALDQRTAALVRQVGSEQAVEQLYNRSIAQIREDYREQVREQLLAQSLQRRKYFQVRITPQEVRAWFSQIPADSIPEVPEIVRVAQIVRFPELDPNARAEARRMIEAVRDSILAGTPIEDLARRHSDDPGSRANGGRYASINLRELVPEFGAVAGRLEPGALSQIFETQFGFHVMRLNERRGDIVDFNHVLIEVDASRTDATEALATLEMVRDSVLAGGSFAALAREYSEDEASAIRGGNVVVPQTGSRDIRFEALSAGWQRTLDTLEVGEVSAPAEVNLLDGRPAYHIVLLQQRTPPHRLSLETDWALIEEFALQEKRQRELQAWVQQLRRDVYIALKDENYCPAALSANL